MAHKICSLPVGMNYKLHGAMPFAVCVTPSHNHNPFRNPPASADCCFYGELLTGLLRHPTSCSPSHSFLPSDTVLNVFSTAKERK